MNNDQPPHATEQPPSITQPAQTKLKSSKRWLLTIVMFLLAIGIGSGGTYALLRITGVDLGRTKQPSGSNTESRNNDQNTLTSNPAWHSVIFGDVNRPPSLAIKLAFPQNYQAIASDNGRDGLRSLFGDDTGNFIYHAGDWEVGNPNDADGNTWGRIQIMGIAKDWYSREGFATYGGFNGDDITTEKNNATVNGYRFYTAAEKNASLKTLASDTANCAKDPSKGFAISGIFDVCYKPYLMRQAYASYDPQITLSGHAVINDTPYVLFGNIRVHGGLDEYNDAQLNKAGDEFQAGKIPAPTQKNIDSFIEAFKHSTIATK